MHILENCQVCAPWVLQDPWPIYKSIDCNSFECVIIVMSKYLSNYLRNTVIVGNCGCISTHIITLPDVSQST